MANAALAFNPPASRNITPRNRQFWEHSIALGVMAFYGVSLPARDSLIFGAWMDQLFAKRVSALAAVQLIGARYELLEII